MITLFYVGLLALVGWAIYIIYGGKFGGPCPYTVNFVSEYSDELVFSYIALLTVVRYWWALHCYATVTKVLTWLLLYVISPFLDFAVFRVDGLVYSPFTHFMLFVPVFNVPEVRAMFKDLLLLRLPRFWGRNEVGIQTLFAYVCFLAVLIGFEIIYNHLTAPLFFELAMWLLDVSK